ELAGIEGFDEDIAGELKNRAQAYLTEQNERLTARRRELGVSDEIAAIDDLTPALLVKLGEAGGKTLHDLPRLATDALIGSLGRDALENGSANAGIMAARAHWFDEAPGESESA